MDEYFWYEKHIHDKGCISKLRLHNSLQIFIMVLYILLSCRSVNCIDNGSDLAIMTLQFENRWSSRFVEQRSFNFDVVITQYNSNCSCNSYIVRLYLIHRTTEGICKQTIFMSMAFVLLFDMLFLYYLCFVLAFCMLVCLFRPCVDRQEKYN